MKYIISFLLLFSISITYLQSQNTKTQKESEIPKFFTIDEIEYFPLQELDWLLDSAYNYLSSPELIWRPSRITRIADRTLTGLPLVFEELGYDSQLEEYFIKIKHTWEYPDINNRNVYTKSLFSIYQETGLTTPYSRYTYINDENGLVSEINEEFYNNSWYGEKTVSYMSNTENYTERYFRNNENEEWNFRGKGHNYDDIINQRLVSYSMEYLDTIVKSYWYYNSEGHKFLFVRYFRDDNNFWLKKYKANYMYNDNNEEIGYNHYYFTDNNWIHLDSIINTYDDFGFLNSTTWIQWRSSGYWKFKEKTDYVNDSLGNILMELSFNDIADTVWVRSQKWEYIFNNNHQMIEKVKSSFYADINSFRNRTKWNWEYDNDLLLSYSIYTWDIADSFWLPKEAERTEYDNQNRKIFFIKERRDSTNQYWVPDYKTEEEYFDSEIQIIRSGVYFDYNVNESIWDSTSKGLTYWNKYLTSTNELPINTFKLYPNPSTEFIIIESDIYHSQKTTYEIFDIQGHILNSGKLSPDGMIKINQLTKGQYFVKVYNPEGRALTLSFVKN
ncbi:T9SS type A sorting domain-containing protein [Lentimicrobium sp. S6]|uniref:T9SS type A sorting domain-containing protein n=1 Tax=Lentimicrobium sp. S6 TaxID=2735872 RepID=UPI00155608E8|nr:T9SS type A sorting domain-containing protein [Lentimicrobium sp. S6]NPD45455.1 T9SS type A sorting domain-containing protein [Lentimicrobium sp. S6]